MRDSAKEGEKWQDFEINLIVADYFEMLSLELAGKPYVKAQRNAALQQQIGRSRGSIEFKHQNISAVMVRLGLPWIVGYKPMSNFQHALLDGIDRHLQAHDWANKIGMHEETEPQRLRAPAGFEEAETLYVAAPPQLTDGDLTIPDTLQRLVRKFDPAERDLRNRALGRRGEARVVAHEKSRLTRSGRSDLADRVRWVSDIDGDGAGYDILSFANNGAERLLEVKTTVGHLTTPFLLSENERALSDERPEAFRILRLYDFARTPRAFEIAPPLESHLILKPTIYRAEFER